MPRAKHFAQYKDIPEIVPGVFVLPGDSVYIVDDEGEVVSWNADEWAEDPNAVTATINAVILAAHYTPSAVRQNIALKGKIINELIQHTGAFVRH